MRFYLIGEVVSKGYMSWNEMGNFLGEKHPPLHNLKFRIVSHYCDFTHFRDNITHTNITYFCRKNHNLTRNRAFSQIKPSAP